MKKLSAIIIALLLAAAPLWAQKTLYVIDNETVEHFDGSQLKGKIIREYKITTTGRGRNAVTVHSITTGARFSLPSFNISEEEMERFRERLKNFQGKLQADSLLVHFGKGTAVHVQSKDYLYIVDGKETEDASAMPRSDRIKSVEVLKDAKTLEAYGKPVIKITTRDSQAVLQEILKKVPDLTLDADGKLMINGTPVKSIIINGSRIKLE
ncbi:MAG: hypothetical protein IJ651_09700 [Bacteroidales bacterium]|nr:hypothetical protein [Bacteroidales bacterium]MBR1570990.1 hypothetical protein [Bacteroidales bacterium]